MRGLARLLVFIAVFAGMSASVPGASQEVDSPVSDLSTQTVDAAQGLRIKHVVIDPLQLVSRPMPAGEWPADIR